MWRCWNSSHVRSEKALWPSQYDRFLALCSSMMWSLETNAWSAAASSSTVE